MRIEETDFDLHGDPLDMFKTGAPARAVAVKDPAELSSQPIAPIRAPEKAPTLQLQQFRAITQGAKLLKRKYPEAYESLASRMVPAGGKLKLARMPSEEQLGVLRMFNSMAEAEYPEEWHACLEQATEKEWKK